ncbi:MAG: hypothetical protein ACTSQJ_01875 [Promethearchaeota archaeon]
MPLILIFAESGIEIIPKKIREHSSVRPHLKSKNYASQLLDNALHHSAMQKLKNFEKRGRPDILHICLLNALGSPLNKSGNLRLFIHTCKNRIFEINPKIRITRNFNRFKGLMAKTLIDGGIITPSIKLIAPYKGTLKNLIDSFNNSKIILFSSRGKLITNYLNLFPKNLLNNFIAIIGCFQKNTYSKYIFDLSKNIISISKYHLDSWVVTNKIITYYELIHKIR